MTADIETMLRETFAARAVDITPASLSDRHLDDAPALLAEPARSGRVAFAIAAAVLLVLASAAVVVSQRDGSERVAPAADAGVPLPDGGTARAWPLNNDAPLPGGMPRDWLATADAAGRTYLRTELGVAPDALIGAPALKGGTAVMSYVFGGVPAQLTLARGADGLWFVTGSDTDVVQPKATLVGDTVVVVVGRGSFRKDRELRAVVQARAADNRVLAEKEVRVPVDKPGTADLSWKEPTLAAAVQVHMYEDAVWVGTWLRAVPAPEPSGLPASVDLAIAEPLFSRAGTPKDVATAYLRDRFPDYPAPDVRLDDVRTRAGRAFARYSSGDAGNRITGRLFLRQAASGWDVVAATTDGVDLSRVELVDGRLQGAIESRNDNSLVADVLTADGAPVAGAPKPGGAMPEAAYRFGTAGGPADRRLVLDVVVAEESFLVRANLVGGTILSIAEVRLSRSRTSR